MFFFICACFTCLSESAYEFRGSSSNALLPLDKCMLCAFLQAIPALSVFNMDLQLWWFHPPLHTALISTETSSCLCFSPPSWWRAQTGSCDSLGFAANMLPHSSPPSMHGPSLFSPISKRRMHVVVQHPKASHPPALALSELLNEWLLLFQLSLLFILFFYYLIHGLCQTAIISWHNKADFVSCGNI